MPCERPGLVSSGIHDIGRSQDVVYLSMDWVRGGSLGDLLRSSSGRRPMSEAAIAEVGAAVASAIEAAHVSGLVHGNLKPDNILLPADWELAPVQFQNAQLTDPVPSRWREFLRCDGVPEPPALTAYPRPESRAARSGSDVRGDLYSLGAVLFHVATGVPPSAEPCAGDEELLRSERADLSGDLTDAIVQMLCPDPAGRFHRPAAVRAVLERVLRSATPGRDDARPRAVGFAAVATGDAADSIVRHAVQAAASDRALDAAMRLAEHGVQLVQQLKGSADRRPPAGG